MREPLVSIIIPTKNIDKMLGPCLDSITAQTYHSVEIVIVDSWSHDETVDIAKRHGAKILSKSWSRIPEARNLGMRVAKGTYIYHMDADMILARNSISENVGLCERGADAVIGPQLFDGHGFLGKAKALEFACHFSDPLIKSSRFMRREVFETIGGYDESLDAGEDWDITQRIERVYKVARANTPVVHGWGKYDVVHAMRRKYRYGKSVRLYMKKHPKEAIQQWSFWRIRNMEMKRVAFDPLHGIGLIIIKTCEFGAGALGIISAFLMGA